MSLELKEPTEEEVLDLLVWDVDLDDVQDDDGEPITIAKERIEEFVAKYPQHAEAIREFAEIYNQQPVQGPVTEAQSRQNAYDDEALQEWIQKDAIPAICSDDPEGNLAKARAVRDRRKAFRKRSN